MRGKFRNLKFEDLKIQSNIRLEKSRLEFFSHALKYISFWLLAFGFCLSSFAQPKNISSSEILHRIEGLKNTATVLYIAAHPDDENTRLISYLTKGEHYRVAYLSLTRGEGGQNLIGTEQGVDLGILRTQELLAARKIDGGEQFFSTAYDFGYSKTPEETLKKWDEKKVLGDIITVMNHLQPDIVICRFPTTGEGGHGHHTASAILAEKAFDSLYKMKANYYPKKLYWNTFNFGSTNTTSEDQLKVDVGGYNALLGKSYGEIAAEARSMHRCQAFGSERRRGEQFEYFKLLKGSESNASSASAIGLMEGIITDWSRFKGGEKINKKIDAIIKAFDVKDPSKSVKELIMLRKLIYKSRIENYKGILDASVKNKIKEINELILDCSGVYIEVTNKFPIIHENDSIHLKFYLANRSSVPVKVEHLVLNGQSNLLFADSSEIDDVGSNNILVENINRISKPWAKYISSPYPVYENRIGFPEEHSNYKIFNYDKNGNFNILYPENRPEIRVVIDLFVENEKFSIEKELLYKFIDPSFGEVFQPVVFEWGDIGQKDLIKQEIKYDHIPTQIYYKKKDPILNFDYVKTNQKKIAYIPGAGDKIPEVLTQIGYDVTLLDETNFPTFQLENFQTIITGVRAYNTQAWLTQYNDKLLKYVEEGGNLVIQYNTSRGLVADIPKPYPFELSRDRVTEEEAEVSLLKKDSPILKYPNLITTDDFKNWIQEFGLYFPTNVDERYEKVLSMHDTGESPNENSLIYCNYGKGKYVYTGLSFFRELPAGVPGAVKLFVNLMEDNEEIKKEELKINNETDSKKKKKEKNK